jgi:hypothetical protein
MLRREDRLPTLDVLGVLGRRKGPQGNGGREPEQATTTHNTSL